MQAASREILFNMGGPDGIVRWLLYIPFIVAMVFLVFGLTRRVQLYKLGQKLNRADNPPKRLINLILDAIFQRRNLREFGPGVAHAAIFFGFAVLFVITLLILLQEDLVIPVFGEKGEFLKGSFYLLISLFGDIFGVALIAGLLYMLVRRYVTRPDRLDNRPMDLTALLILLFLCIGGFFGESLRIAITGRPEFEVWSPVGWTFARILEPIGEGPLRVIHWINWWIHMLLANFFIAYIPYSKMIHIVTSSANTYAFKKNKPVTLPPIENLEEAETYGVGNPSEYTWKQLLDGDACTRCGRCQARCPAHNSDKPLSPKKITQDVKKAMDDKLAAKLYENLVEYYNTKAKSFSKTFRDISLKGTRCMFNIQLDKDGKPVANDKKLVGDYILPDEIWACTTCMACEYHCPVMVEHVEKIIQMRRYLVLTEGETSPEVGTCLRNLENNSNPWGMGSSQRFDWAQGLSVPTIAEKPDAEYLYFVGCAGSFDERYKKVSRAFVELLNKAGVSYAVLGADEQCCGDPARRIGNEYLFYLGVQANVEMWNELGIKKIITTCPHGYNIIKNEYPDFGGKYEVFHATEILAQLLRDGKLKPNRQSLEKLTFHDSCYLGRYNSIYDAPRYIIQRLGGEITELEKSRDEGFCCGAGGGRMFMEENLGRRINHVRLDQIMTVNPKTVASACPFCLTMISDGIKETNREGQVESFDVIELLRKSIEIS
jgi:Fe-S oxidoreductase/nitrate reductase gamma subunit